MSAAASTKRANPTALLRRMADHARDLQAELAHEPHSDSLAQAAVCAAPILAALSEPLEPALAWLSPQLAPWEQRALCQAQVLSTQYLVLSTSNSSLSHPHTLTRSHPRIASHLYDLFLHHHSKTARKRHGVFFTPQPLADYIVTQIDRLLRNDFNLPNGLAQSQIPDPQSQILFLDPACGTGVFLLTLIDRLHRLIPRRRWNAFVPDLLSRLIGIEILPSAAFLCKLNITLNLASTGYDFSHPCELRILAADALDHTVHSTLRTPHSAFPVLLGNPPFSSLSTTTNPW